MSISAIRAGQAFYEIFAENKTEKGIASAEASLRAFGMRIGAIGLSLAGFADAGLAGIGAMVQAFAGAGDEISDAMNVTGLSSDFLQTLQFGAADAGVEFNALIQSLTKFNQGLAKAASKGGKIAGLDAKSLMAMKPDERIKAVVDEIEKIPDPALRAKAAMEAFGKSGAKLLPAFEGGAAALNEQMEDLKNRGLIMSDEDRQLAVQAEGAFLSMGLAIDRVTQVIAAAATPAFLAVFDVIQTVIEGVVQFIDNNRSLVATLTIGLGVLSAVGTALFAIGVGAIMLSYVSAGFAAIGAVLAALVSPIALIVAAIVACGAAALVSAYYLDQLFNGGAALQFLADAAGQAMQGIQMLWTAISNGRWGLAGQLIADHLNLGFANGILALKQAWVGFATWLTDLMASLMQGVSDLVIAGMQASLNRLRPLAERIGGSALGAFIGAQAALDVGRQQQAGLGDGMRQRIAREGNAILNDAQSKVAQAAAQLATTMAEINRLEEDKNKAARGDLPDWEEVSDQMLQSSRIAQSAGFASSIGAGRLGFAAPANQAEEKQVDLLQQILAGQQEQTDAIENLEGLTVE